MTVSRRGLLRGASGLAGAAALGGLWSAGSPAAWAAGESSAPDRVVEEIVRDASMAWRRPPTGWQTGPFLGNGFLGVQVYQVTANTLRFMLSHSQVQDQRVQWEAAIGLSRLPIGYLTLTLAGTVTAVDWQLDLWNAELSGTITTTQGSVAFSALVHNSRGVLLVSLRPGGGEDALAWAFQPMPSATTRTVRKPPEYVANPDPTLGTAGDVSYAEQPLIAGGGYTTAWQERRIGTRRLLAATVAYSFPDATSTADAVRTVRSALAGPPDLVVAAHRAWWHRFYPRSLVSVPDKWLQRFYWIQLYKMASATRAEAPVLSEWGPWFPEKGASWTAVWWNLNVQVAYPFINGANHLELDAVTRTLRTYESNLSLSVPPAYRDGETYALSHPGDRTLRPGDARTVGIPGPGNANDQTGNLTWGLHTAWASYRHTMDDNVLRTVIYPILAKALNYYLKFLVDGPDGATRRITPALLPPAVAVPVAGGELGAAGRPGPDAAHVHALGQHAERLARVQLRGRILDVDADGRARGRAGLPEDVHRPHGRRGHRVAGQHDVPGRVELRRREPARRRAVHPGHAGGEPRRCGEGVPVGVGDLAGRVGREPAYPRGFRPGRVAERRPHRLDPHPQRGRRAARPPARHRG